MSLREQLLWQIDEYQQECDLRVHGSISEVMPLMYEGALNRVCGKHTQLAEYRDWIVARENTYGEIRLLRGVIPTPASMREARYLDQYIAEHSGSA